MAGEEVQILIRAKNDANSAINQAIGQLKVLEGQGIKAGSAPRLQLATLTNQIGALSPEAARAASTLSSIASAGSGIGAIVPVVGAVALALGGIVKLGAGLADAVESLDRLSFATGASVEQLQVVKRTLEQAGIAGDSLTEPMRRLSREIENGNPLLDKLGITSRDAFTAMRQLATVLAASEDEAKRNTATNALLGRAHADVAAGLQAVALGYDSTRERMIESGSLIRDDVLRATRELDASMDQLKESWTGAWTQMQTSALPAATNIVGGLNNIIAAFNRLTAAQREWNGEARETSDMFARRLREQRSGTRESRGGGGTWEDPGLIGPPVPLDLVLQKTGAIAKSAKQATDMLRDLREAAGFTSGVSDERRGVGRQPIGIDEQVPDVEAVLSPAVDAMKRFREQVSELADSTFVGLDLMAGAFSGFSSGLVQVFTNLDNKMQTIKSAVVTIIKSMVSEILAALARLAAARLFTLLLKLTGIGAPAGMLIDSAVGVGAGALLASAGGTIAPTFSAGGGAELLDRLDQVVRGMEKLVRAPVTVNVSALDAKSVEQMFNSPLGSGLAAQRAAGRGGSW